MVNAAQSEACFALQAGQHTLSDRSLEDCKVLLAIKCLLSESAIRVLLLQHALPDALAALTGLHQLLAGFPSILQTFTPSVQMLLGTALLTLCLMDVHKLLIQPKPTAKELKGNFHL